MSLPMVEVLLSAMVEKHGGGFYGHYLSALRVKDLDEKTATETNKGGAILMVDMIMDYYWEGTDKEEADEQ